MKHALAIATAVSILIISLVQQSLAQDGCPRPRLISVSGTSEINVAPDEAVLALGIESRDKQLSVAKSENDSRARKVVALARAAGVDQKNVQTSALRMGPYYSDEKIPHLLGYEVSQEISITLKDLSKYENLMTQLLEAGVNRVKGISFRLSQPRKYKDEARSKAILAAKEKAVALATALGQTVGKPWEISEQFEDSTVAVQTNVSYDTRTREEELTVAPGQVVVRASVTASFQLE